MIVIVEKSGAPPLAPSTFPLTPSTPPLALIPWSFPLPFKSSIRSSLPSLRLLPLSPLPTYSPVPPPNDSAASRPTLRVHILGGIIYTRENMGNV
ncbi:hypothetical protein Tco_0325699, partial [Tanacetum coccineum]